MPAYPLCRVLALIGSGETSPTMVTVHRDLVSRIAVRRPLRAVLLATPDAFQENADDVSARAARYFADSVGLPVQVAAGASPEAGPAVAPPLTGGDGQAPGAGAGDAAGAGAGVGA